MNNIFNFNEVSFKFHYMYILMVNPRTVSLCVCFFLLFFIYVATIGDTSVFMRVHEEI